MSLVQSYEREELAGYRFGDWFGDFLFAVAGAIFSSRDIMDTLYITNKEATIKN